MLGYRIVCSDHELSQNNGPFAHRLYSNLTILIICEKQSIPVFQLDGDKEVNILRKIANKKKSLYTYHQYKL